MTGSLIRPRKGTEKNINAQREERNKRTLRDSTVVSGAKFALQYNSIALGNRFFAARDSWTPEQHKDSVYPKLGIEYREGMSEDDYARQALTLDYNKRFDNSDPNRFLYYGAALPMELIEPLNLVGAGLLMKGAKVGHSLGTQALKFHAARQTAKSAAVVGAVGAGGVEVAKAPLVYDYEKRLGNQAPGATVALNVGLSTVAGGALGSLAPWVGKQARNLLGLPEKSSINPAPQGYTRYRDTNVIYKNDVPLSEAASRWDLNNSSTRKPIKDLVTNQTPDVSMPIITRMTPEQYARAVDLDKTGTTRKAIEAEYGSLENAQRLYRENDYSSVDARATRQNDLLREAVDYDILTTTARGTPEQLQAAIRDITNWNRSQVTLDINGVKTKVDNDESSIQAAIDDAILKEEEELAAYAKSNEDILKNAGETKPRADSLALKERAAWKKLMECELG